MHIAGFYFLAYPDSCPVDPTFAASEVYVEVAEEGELPNTFAFQIYTFRYFQREFIDRGRSLMARSVMIVPTLADDGLLEFLEANADTLPRLGELR